MSVLQGGKFGHGFIAAGVSQGFADKINGLNTGAGRIIASALVGGTVSRVTGGKFANGAATAEFGRLFNEAAHALKEASDAQEARYQRAKDRFNFVANSDGKTMSAAEQHKFLTAAALIIDETNWADATPVDVVFDPAAAQAAGAHGFAKWIGGTPTITMGNTAKGGLYRSIVAEEIFHSSDMSMGFLPENKTWTQAHLSEYVSIGRVITYRSQIGFDKARFEQLAGYRASYRKCYLDKKAGRCL